MANELKTINENDERLVEGRRSSHDLLELSDAITVDSGEMNVIANDGLSEARALRKKIDEVFEPILDPLNTALKNTRALKNKALEPIDAAEATFKRKIGQFVEAEEAKRAAQTREERRRQEEETAAAQRALEEALGDENATETDREEAAAAVTAAEVRPMQVFTAPVELGNNVGRKLWSAEVVDLPKLLRYLADEREAADKAGTAPRFVKTIEIKIGELQKFASSTNGTIPVPGVRFVQKTSIAARAS